MYTQRLYVVGADAERGRYRVLKVDRTAAAAAAVTAKLATDDGQWYGPAELRQLLAMIHDGNLYGGYGLRLVAEGVHGIVGFVRFLDAHYLYVVTKSSVVAHIGGHAIRRVDETRLLPLGYAPGSSSGGSNSGGSGNTGNASTATATPPPTKDPLEQKYAEHV